MGLAILGMLLNNVVCVVMALLVQLFSNVARNHAAENGEKYTEQHAFGSCFISCVI
jgi:hypothetical protein